MTDDEYIQYLLQQIEDSEDSSEREDILLELSQLNAISNI